MEDMKKFKVLEGDDELILVTFDDYDRVDLISKGKSGLSGEGAYKKYGALSCEVEKLIAGESIGAEHPQENGLNFELQEEYHELIDRDDIRTIVDNEGYYFSHMGDLGRNEFVVERAKELLGMEFTLIDLDDEVREIIADHVIEQYDYTIYSELLHTGKIMGLKDEVPLKQGEEMSFNYKIGSDRYMTVTFMLIMDYGIYRSIVKVTDVTDNIGSR